MASLLALPLDLVRRLTDTIAGLTELPAALERTMRETNGLIAESRAQLVMLREQADRIVVQLEKMTAIVDRLVDATGPMTGMAEEARRQMAITSEQLAATNGTLQEIVRLAGPLDRLGKRVSEGLLRVTGRRGASESDSGSGT